MMKTLALALLLGSAVPVHGALLGSTGALRRSVVPIMCATPHPKSTAGVDVNAAAQEAKKALSVELINSFLTATERGDASAAMSLCTTDFLYKTHRATTESLAAAEERFHTKVPAPSKVAVALHAVEESPGVFEREIVVKPIPFVTVAVRQIFEVRRNDDGTVRLARAEYVKQ